MTVLKTGSQGNDVLAYQQKLKDAGYNISVDGVYGPQTAEVTRQYQATKGLTVDGIAGPQTLGSFNTGSTGNNTTTSYINQLADSQRAAALAQLKSTLNQANTTYNTQETALGPTYNKLFTNADVANQQAVRRLSEWLAAKGVATGQQGTQQAYLQAQGQQGLSDLRLQKQSELNDISGQRSLAQLNYATGEQQAISDIEAQRAQMLMEQANADRDYGLQLMSLKSSGSGGSAAKADLNDYINMINQYYATTYANGNLVSYDQSAIWDRLNYDVQRGALSAADADYLMDYFSRMPSKISVGGSTAKQSTPVKSYLNSLATTK